MSYRGCFLLFLAGCASPARTNPSEANGHPDLASAPSENPDAEAADPDDAAELAPDLGKPPDLGDEPDLRGASADLASADLASADLLPPSTPDMTKPTPVVDFVVVRVGDGSASLTNAATPVFLERRRSDGMSVGTPIALPTQASGAQQPFTISGSANSEGALSRSGDGRYLVLGGFAAPSGTASIASTDSATVKRVVARVDAAGNVDTSTTLASAFSGGDVRAATSFGGDSFWVSGTATPASTGGVHWVTFGSTGASTQVAATPSNVRFVNVFGGQLYATSGSASYTAVFTVGSALPTSAAQTTTTLPGMPTSNASPYSFVLLDLDPKVAGLDTLYVADDRATPTGGVQKLTFDGSTWKQVATFGASGMRGLAGALVDGQVLLAATSTETQNKLWLLVDTGGTSAPQTLLATAAANTAYRGVALAPQ